MTRIQQLEREAMALTDGERAALATRLLQTLPAVLSDEDEGIAEALRRDAELDANPASGMSWDDLRKELGR
jgi:putative addiction module component (TIGR02574 family)